MADDIKLSYVITTYNKLNFLKLILERLIESIEHNEEIIVTDGGSIDGTNEYLLDLLNQGKIAKFISEKDKGESHGFNKGIFLANGELVKIISDDDAFCYPTIKACKVFMLSHPEIDVLGGNTGGVDILDKGSLFLNEEYYPDFLKWKDEKLKRFFFNGTCLMIRKSSIPLTGLFNTNVVLSDTEFTLRVTGIANIAWCTGIISVRIYNPQSNNSKFKERVELESKQLCSFYEYQYPWERKLTEDSKKPIYKKVKSIAAKYIKNLSKESKKVSRVLEPFSSFEEVHLTALKWMEAHDLNRKIEFDLKN